MLVLKMEMSQQVVILIILLGIGTQYYLSNKVDFQHFKRKVFKRCETLLLEWQTWLDRISSADFNENTEVTQDKTKDNFVEPDRPLTEEGYYGTSPEPRLVHPNKVFKLRKKGGTKIPSFESSTKIKRGNLYFLVNSGH